MARIFIQMRRRASVVERRQLGRTWKALNFGKLLGMNSTRTTLEPDPTKEAGIMELEWASKEEGSDGERSGSDTVGFGAHKQKMCRCSSFVGLRETGSLKYHLLER